MDNLPAVVSPYGAYAGLGLHVHDLTIRGHHGETLIAADAAEGALRILGDGRTYRVSRLGRMYALSALGRPDEALRIGEELVADTGPFTGPRTTDAKILADTARMLIQVGRMDEGLHYVARAMAMLDVVPRKSLRYFSAMASLADAAREAELFELAEVAMLQAINAFEEPNDIYRSGAELQYAEFLLEWALRLEQVQREEEAAVILGKSVTILTYWSDRGTDAPIGEALLALGYAKQGRLTAAQELVDKHLMPMRAGGHNHETRALHMAHGLVLRSAGDLRAARREFLAGDELCVLPAQRLNFQFELAVTAAMQSPGEASSTMLGALHAHIRMLWQLRLDRRTMLHQSYKRVELEAARKSADRQATSDALTGLGNRRMFDSRMSSMSGAGALLLIDVDRFKAINDEFSHGVGDRVLGEIAAVLRAHCRHDEVAIRFGGDEFALFLSTGELESRQVAERIRQVILSRDWSTIAPGLRVTLSMGLATCRPGETGDDLYTRADANLYAAKRGGRNRLAAAA
ncbi:tetratricopeptide repeat-containing diguanylate cyclase [Winogradskya humida]|uniref:Diguanylate cyclase n=1 Tax=Winogradskya humida TaxID=113566 RepID=A0ABQ3ZJH6_9ACTN|nr:GGDEF domain-containing protein [Actinoplanes humidus]GIE18707.1 diguanylate cyclase [Actinoplanes humidus]